MAKEDGSMTKGELKEKLTQLCAEWAKENNIKIGSFVLGVSINPEEVSSNLQVTRYVSSKDTVA